MKITFVGSSHGVPEPHRKCTCIMIEVGESIYFVDMGTSAIEALVKRGKSVDAVKGVFVTHMHGDHTNGLIQFADLITWYYKTPDPLICLPMPEAESIINSWLDITLNGGEKKLRYAETHEGLVFDDGTLRVTAVPTQHCEKSFAYIVQAKGKTVLFTGDLKNPQIDFPEPAMNMALNLVVCESAHFEATDYIPVFEKCDIKRVCVTHYSDHFLASVLALVEHLNGSGIPAVRTSDDLEIEV